MDIVEPLDIENEIENQVDVTSEEDVEIKNLADYPSDDLQVNIKVLLLIDCFKVASSH